MIGSNNFINNLIPERFVITPEQKIKARGFIITQAIIGTLLITVGLFMGIYENDWVEFTLNISIGVYISSIIFTMRFFTNLENYANTVLLGSYLGTFVFILLGHGLFGDAIFFLALLLLISINYTKQKHTIFWVVIISVFFILLYYLHFRGLTTPNFEPSIINKTTTLITFFAVAIIITYSYSIINRSKLNHHLEVIEKHKRLLKERDDLMSVIAHDLKSPINRIEGLVGVFDIENLTKDQKNIINRLQSTALESKQLIEDLLKAKSFQSKLTIEKTDIKSLINDLVTGFLPLANKKGIRVMVRGLNSINKIETSAHELKRILDNLLSNAIKYSPEDTRVEIVCVQNNHKLSISIQDQGPGFSKEDEQKMFQKFQQLSARPTAGESSTGLGLSIVKNLSELLGGTIKYVTKPRRGTTFTLVIPNKLSLA